MYAPESLLAMDSRMLYPGLPKSRNVDSAPGIQFQLARDRTVSSAPTWSAACIHKVDCASHDNDNDNDNDNDKQIVFKMFPAC